MSTPVSARDQRGLAVVDVAGGAERQERPCRRHRAPSGVSGARRHVAQGRRAAAAASAISSSVSVRGSSSTRPSWMRPITGGSARAQRLQRARPGPRSRSSATAGPSSSSSGSAPPPTLALARIDARRRGPIRSAQARRPSPRAPARRRRASPAPGSRGGRARGRGTACSVASSAASESLSIRSARARGCAARRRDGVARPTSRPGLRAAEQLVARAADERRAGGDRAPDRRLVAERRDSARVGQHPGADVVDHRRRRARTAPRSGRPRRIRRRGSSTGARAGSRRRVRRSSLERPLVVRQPRAVRRAHLDQLARRTGRSPRGSGSRRRSRRAGRARR